MTTVVYIHGFGSSSQTEKAFAIRDFCADQSAGFLAVDYDTSANFRENLEKIQDLLPYDDMIFVGSSLGGCYALHLANITASKCVLINPSLDPTESLAKYGIPAEIRESYSRGKRSTWGTIALLDSTDDVIPYNTYLEYLSEFADVRIFSGFGHRFNNFSAITQAIKDLMNWQI